MVSSTDARQRKTTYGYDEAGRRTSAAGPDAPPTRYTYDGVGNLKTVEAPQHRTTKHEHDNVNRLKKTIYADNKERVLTYDDAGRKIAEQDQDGKITGFAYDGLDRLIAVTNAFSLSTPSDQTITRYEYDAVGNLTKIIDAASPARETTFEYDPLGRRTRRTLPGGKFEEFVYDELGNVKSRKDFAQRTTIFEYDELNRLIKKTPDSFFNLQPTVFSYTASGQRASMTYPVATGTGSGTLETVTYAYRDQDRLWKKITPQGTIEYSYDENGNVETITVPLSPGNPSTKITYAWDNSNRLKQVKDESTGAARITTYNYNPTGTLQDYTYPNGVATSFTDYSALDGIKHMSAPPATFHYDLWNSGMRKSLEENIVNAGPRTINYSYDALWRLTKETIAGAGPAGDISYDSALSYGDTSGFDPVGNRRRRDVNLTPAVTTSSFTSRNYSYDTRDRLQTFDGIVNTSDDNGNTLRGEVYPAQTADDLYDSENRLVKRTTSGKSFELAYDADGIRVRKTERDSNNNIIKQTYPY